MRRFRSKTDEEKKMLEKVGMQVKLAPFFTFDSETGDVQFYGYPPCPRCGFTRDGEMAGIFECEVCGYAEVDEYSKPHGQNLLLEGCWRLARYPLKGLTKTALAPAAWVINWWLNFKIARRSKHAIIINSDEPTSDAQ
jgi:hypothetical protein